MKRIFALLCTVLLVGCGSGEQNATKQNETSQQEVVQEQTSQSEESASNNKENNRSEVSNNKEENQTARPSKEQNGQSESGEIRIETEGFVENMDKLFTDLDKYEGKTVSYEGLLIEIDEATHQHAVVRLYEVNHEDHSHSIYVGLNVNYDGEWPLLDSWVQVRGTIERSNDGGEDYPTLKVDEITVLPEQGQLAVTN
ncbi:MAG: hypothetical protein E7231_15395 [Cellulosilyticum sp.]|nr:hypothetical protein [Cellulosilyticum sp.]